MPTQRLCRIAHIQTAANRLGRSDHSRKASFAGISHSEPNDLTVFPSRKLRECHCVKRNDTARKPAQRQA